MSGRVRQLEKYFWPSCNMAVALCVSCAAFVSFFRRLDACGTAPSPRQQLIFVGSTTRLVVTVLITALYLFGAVVAGSSVPLAGPAHHSHADAAQHKFFAPASASLVGHASSAENSINPPSQAPFSGGKSPFKAFHGAAVTSEEQRASTFAQYAFASQDFPIRLRKADAIFPFHSFW